MAVLSFMAGPLPAAAAADAPLSSSGIAASPVADEQLDTGMLNFNSISGIQFPTIQLNGLDQSVNASNVLDLTDATGSGAGWTISLTSTEFTDSSGYSLPPEATDITTTSPTGCDPGSACSNATNTLSTPIMVPAGTDIPSASPIFSAAPGSGAGSMSTTVNEQLSIPGGAQAGAYSSTWVYTLSSGPVVSDQSAPVPPPDTPTGLTATAQEGSVLLSWDASSNPSVDAYLVYEDSVWVGTVDVPSTSYTVTGLDDSTSYEFSVAAEDQYNQVSTISAAVSATPGLVTSADVAGSTDSVAASGPTSTGTTTGTADDQGTTSTTVNTGTGTSTTGSSGSTTSPSTTSPAATTTTNPGSTSSPSTTSTSSEGTSSPSTTSPAATTTTNPAITTTSGSTTSPSTTPEGTTSTSSEGTSSPSATSPAATTTTNPAITTTSGSTTSPSTTPEGTTSTTAAPPQAPTGVTATVSSQQVVLSWDAANGATGYTVERTAAAGQAAQVYSGTALSFTDQGLTNGTAYTYTVAAQGPWGSAAANSVTATPEAVPAAPAGVQGAAGDGEVTLSWSVVGVPGPDTPVTYSVSLDGTPVASGLSTTDYTVTGLADGTSYTFTVAATDSYNQVSAASDPVGVTPLGVPAAPSGVTAVETDGQVALSWAPASASLAAPVAGYYVERDGVQIGQVAGASSSSYTDTTVGAGSTYTYSVQAYNAVSMSATTSATSITVVAAPAIPSGLVATPTNGQVALSWDADPNANNYVLYSDGNQIYSGAGTGFAYNNLANDTVYTFYVMASGPGGTSAGSATVSATPEAVPAAPGDLQVAPEDTSAQLSWDAPATKSPQQPVTYTVFVNGVTAQMGVSGTSATISGLTDGTSYTFAVTATDAYGQVSGPSDQVSATPVGTPAAPSGASATEVDGQVELSWAPASSSAAAPVVGYNIYSGSSEVGTVTGASSSSWTDTSVVPGSTYTYSVQAYNAAASSGPAVAAPITVVAAPAAPGSLAASPTAGQVALSWDSSGGATAYYLYRGSTVVYNGTATAYTDTGLTNNTQYTYYVEAEGPGGLSGPSGAVTTTPEAAPAAPTGVAVVTGVSTATVSWDAPPTQPPQQPVTYSVYGNNNLLVAGVAGTSTTIDSLASGQYTFTVTATDAYGQVSAPSAGAVAQVQTAAQQYSAAVLADSPFAFWPMDDPAGSSVMMDTSSASTNVGTYNGTYTLGTDPGPLAGTTALGLTGAGYAAYSSSLPASNAYTLEMWFELGAGCATAGAGCTLFSSGPQYLDVEVNSPNDPGGTGLEFTVGNGTSSSTADIAQTLTAGTWYMLDLTVGADGTWGGYLDGALIGSGSSVAAPYIWGAGTVQLGASNGATGVSLTGDLADVAVYNSVLGPSQVAVDWFASQAVAAASQTATTSPTTTSPAATTTSPAATTTSLAGTTAGPAATTTGPAATTTDPAATTTTTVSPAATTTN